MGSVIRPSTGQPQIPVEHQTVIIVDKEGVPQAVGSPGGGGATAVDIGAETNTALKSSPQPISATALPLPTGAATEVTQLAVLAQLQGDRAITSNLFIDSTSTTYLRVLAFNQQTNAYEATVLTLAGAPYTPVPPETSLAKSDLDTTETSWEIRVSGTGYTVGDIVSQFNFLSQSPPAVIATLWFNQTTQLALASAPLAAHRRRTDGLAATEATLAAINTKTPSVGQALAAASTPVVIASDDAQFGNKSTAATLPTGGLGLLGWVSDQYRLLLSTFTAATAPFAKITDGTNTATVKAASTAAVAADPSVVVAISPNTPVLDQLAPVSGAIVDVPSAAITATANTAVFTPTWGVSQYFSIVVSAVTGTTPTMDVTVQESPDNGTTWNNIFTFLQITAAGTYNSPVIAQAGKQYRYAQTVAGTTPSFTRAINRYQSNVLVEPYAGVSRLGGINPASAEFLVGSRSVRRIYASNTTAVALFIQYHNKPAALVNGDIPVSGEIYALPAVSGANAGICLISPSDLPSCGLNCGGNTRVAISSTRNTYTAAVMAGVNLNIEVTA
jgi:hypothetical protein